VAVDPEMLGKVFEELVTGRHETGSYYTHKPIVSFMCREALKGYLESNLPKQTPKVIARFVDEHDPSPLQDAEAVLEALRRVRVCDPACGSGAYLLGMLHELMDLRTCLFSTKRLDPISAYDRKLEIIQRNVYGVDKDAFATNIAKLRLWLSLAVEFEGEAPPPLPNLDFKIEQGDALLSPQPAAIGQQAFRQQAIDAYFQAKTAYLTAHGNTKRTLRTQIVHLRQDIALWVLRCFTWVDMPDRVCLR
jgi:type I restriction-modification system DNA methylase subunit